MKNSTTSQTPAELLEDLRRLVTEAEEKLGDTAGDTADDVMSNIRARCESARERFTDFYSDAKKKVVAGAKVTDDAIRANPYQSLAIVLGVGVLIGGLTGALIARRGK